MSEKKTIETAPVTKASEPEFYIHQLRERSRKEFGVKPEVLDGALFNYTEPKISKSETRKRIDDFLGRSVKQ